MIRVLAVAALLVSTSAHALHPQARKQDLRLEAPRLKFRYMTYDGSMYFSCEHKVFNSEAGDWDVTCKDGSFKREYRVHLWVSLYTHPSEPRSSYETLYWITDRTRPMDLKAHTSTVWFHLKELSALSSLEFRQGVDSDTAYLEMTFDTSGVRAAR